MSWPKFLYYYSGNYEWRLKHLIGPFYYMSFSYDDDPDGETKEPRLLRTSIKEEAE